MSIHSRWFLKKLKPVIVSLSVLALAFALHSCGDTEQKAAGIYGKYKASSDDPAINKFLAGEDNYLELRNNQTIVYNTTINGKPKFHFTGTFALDEPSKTVNITWKDNEKLPKKLTIENKDEKQVITVGQTNYIKQKPD